MCCLKLRDRLYLLIANHSVVHVLSEIIKKKLKKKRENLNDVHYLNNKKKLSSQRACFLVMSKLDSDQSCCSSFRLGTKMNKLRGCTFCGDFYTEGANINVSIVVSCLQLHVTRDSLYDLCSLVGGEYKYSKRLWRARELFLNCKSGGKFTNSFLVKEQFFT